MKFQLFTKSFVLSFAYCITAGSLHVKGQIVAHDNQFGVIGAQALGSSLIIGLDFTVNSPVQVTQLGVFDSGSDGVFAKDFEVALFNRDTGQAVTSTLISSTVSNGSPDAGSRFKSLATPVTLPAGFNGSIVAGPYAAPGGEPNGNVVHQPQRWSFNDGGGLLIQGDARYNLSYVLGSGLFLPASSEVGLPDPMFAAGTFKFIATPASGPLLVNGSFELPGQGEFSSPGAFHIDQPQGSAYLVGWTSWFWELPPGSEYLPGWTIGGGGVDDIGKDGSASSGSYYLDLVKNTGDPGGSISKQLSGLEVGTNYYVFFDVNQGVIGAGTTITVSAGPVSLPF